MATEVTKCSKHDIIKIISKEMWSIVIPGGQGNAEYIMCKICEKIYMSYGDYYGDYADTDANTYIEYFSWDVDTMKKRLRKWIKEKRGQLSGSIWIGRK